jgi:hypothetical protein
MHFQVKKNNHNHTPKQIYVRISANSIMVCMFIYCKSNLKISFRNYYALNLHANMRSLIKSRDHMFFL